MSSRLDEILDTLQQNSADQVAIATRGGHTRFPEVKAEAKAEIKSLMREILLGEPGQLLTYSDDKERKFIENFIKTRRKKIEQL